MSALREILARFGVDVDTRGLENANSSITEGIDKLKKFAGVVGGSLALGAIYHFVSGLTEEADALAKQAMSVGVSLEALQQWQYAAKMSGVSAELLATTLARLSGGRFKAEDMKKLGVETEDAGGKARGATEMLDDIAEALVKIENPAERNKLAMGVLGRSYSKLLPLLLEGKDGLRKLREEFVELGGGFTEEFAKDADDFGDNIDRVKTIWKNLTIYALSRVLPTLLAMSKRIVVVVRAIVPLVKNSKVLEAAFVMLTAKGVLVVSKMLGPLGSAFKTLLTRVLPIIIAFLAIEDFLVFMAGGDSVIGAFLEKAFGEGSSKKVRDWINGVKAEFLSFVDDLRNHPQKIAEDWAVFTSQLRKDIGETFGPFWGGLVNGALTEFLFVLDLMTGGWDNFTKKTGALWAGLQNIVSGVLNEIRGLGLGVGADIGDAFNAMWNRVLSSGMQALAGLRKIVAALPGTGGLVKDIDAAISGVDAARKPTDTADKIEAQTRAERLRLSLERDTIRGNLGLAQPSQQIDQTNSVIITVPPGTDIDTARRVGAAAEAGIQRSNRALQAALVPDKG